MSVNLYDAHRQWATRLPDQRFPDLSSLFDYVNQRRIQAVERTQQFQNLSMMIDHDDCLALNGEYPAARFSHWSFGQFCEWMNAPAPYMRKLPVDLVAQCLQFGLSKSSSSCQMLVRKNGQSTLAAITGPKYSRIWDADIVETLMRSVEGTAWHVPSASANNNSEHAELYASDRDMFAFFVNDEHTIEIDGIKLGRGFFCWNSETGAASFGITTFLMNSVCGNHIVWGAEQVQELRIIHRDNAANRFRQEAIPVLERFVENSSIGLKVRDAIIQARRTPVGNDLEQVLRWGEDSSLTQYEVTRAWETGKAEGEDVSTLWGMVQGITAFARPIPFMNTRVNLERRAGTLLQSGLK